MSPRLCNAIYLLVVAVSGCGETSPPAASPGDSGAAQTVELVVDDGDGGKKAYRVDWSPKLTVLAAMQRAQQSEKLDFQYRHSGEMAFLDAIGATKNEPGPGGRSWIYHVNGEEADVGFGARELAPGDVVLWRLQKSKYNP
jgi:hypothetical protein